MKKAVLGGIAAFAVSALLAGCSGGGTTPSSAPTEKVTLTFQSLAFQKTTIAATKAIVDSWNQQNPNIQVNLVQGSWNNVHDQLVTQFAGGTAPDIIHDESADIAGFAKQGYLADLTKYITPAIKKDVSADVWKSVTSNGKIVAEPTLLQSYVVFANTDAFAAAGQTVPSGSTLTWDQLGTLAKSLTGAGKFGLGWGLKAPTATVMNLALGFGGGFFSTASGATKITVGSNELAVPQRIHDMAFKDASLDPVTLTQSGSDVLPGFYGGKYAMYVGGNYIAQQLTQSAPAGFHWAVLPPLAGTKGTAQAANPQTLSVSAQSKHIKEAAQFVNYVMQQQNLSKLAEGDWLIPSTASASAQVEKDTGGKNGWTQTLQSAKGMMVAPFQLATHYPQWKDQIATPALQQYFANKITLDQLATKLTDGWTSVNG